MQVRRLAAAAALLLCLASFPARAEDVRVLAAGAVQAAVRHLEVGFSAASGHTLKPEFDTVGALRNRVLAGERVDVVILSEAGMGALEAAGKIDPGSRIGLGSTAVALAVRKGAPMPDLSSADALRSSLLAATSITYADPARGATAGAHFAGVLDRLGIAAEVRARVTVLPFGGDVIKAVAEGRFEIGVSQSSEIVAHADVVLAGRLPSPFDHRTRYVAAKGVGAGPGADAFLAMLQSSAGRTALMEIGFAEP